MPRRTADSAVDRAQHGQPRPSGRNAATAGLTPEHLSPAKRRIAEALAAMLVAHYRRQHEQTDHGRAPVV